MAKAMPYYDRVKLFVDGACRGNPGSGATGVLILDTDNNELERHCECIGHTTNNRAEYKAVIRGLKLAAKHTRDEVTVYSDSELVIKQMNGEYRIKNEELQKLFIEVRQLESIFKKKVIYTHVARTNPHIKKVDRDVNEALEGRK